MKPHLIFILFQRRVSLQFYQIKVGDAVHLETDVFKYVENIMNHQKSKLTEDKLRAFGFRRNLYAI